MYERLIQSPVGPLLLVSDGSALTRARFRGQDPAAPSCPVLERTAAELRAYFAGELRAFTVPLAPAGTDFQKRVWEELSAIPCGETDSYGRIAARLGKPGAARAVAAASSRNPIPILIPCHRAVGADGSLTGYAWGLEIKRFLLELEGAGHA